jgi:hypothetical protein
MSLTPLTNYKTLSDKRLLESFNEAMTIADANFAYTLGQVASPVPSLTGVAQNSVIAVGQNGSNNILEYANPNDLINLQTVFSSYLDQNSKINITDNLEFSVNSLIAPFSNFSITSRGSSGAGAINNYMRLTQLSNSGELSETHVVSAFSLTSDSISLTTNTGFIELNKLQVGNYKFPNAAGTSGQVLRLAAANTLEFATIANEITAQTDNYVLSQNKPLLLSGKGNSDVSLALYDLNSGIGASAQSASGNQEVFFKFNNSRLLSMTKPANPIAGSASAPYLKIEGPLALPNSSGITTQTSHEGSVWYDSVNKSLVLVTDQGKLNIKAQSGSVAAAVNTEEAKSFNFNPASSIVLGSGSNNAPALKVGNIGFAADSQNLNVVFGTAPVIKVSSTAIESSVQANGAAKVVFDNALGLNNPLNPTYTFSGASQLGMYRSAANAIGIAVQGQCVSEFASNGLDLKNKKIFNVGTPTGMFEAANKAYVDGKIPTGSVANSIATYNTASGRYLQSDAKYSSGVLEIGSGSAVGSLLLKTTSGGSVSLRAPTGSQNLVFLLPTSSVTNGILRVNSTGQMYWDTLSTVTSGLLKADGSVQVTDTLTFNNDFTASKPMLSANSAGMYAAANIVGFSANGNKIIELNGQNNTLTGAATTFNAPYVRLNSTINSYAANPSIIQPTYSFAGNNTTGIGQVASNEVTVVLNNAAKLTVKSGEVSVHSSKIINLAAPTANSDAATKEYVDNKYKSILEIAFRITQLPAGWSNGNSIILSIVDKALVYQSAIANLISEPATYSSSIVIPSDFNTNSNCECFVENFRLVKMAKASGVRQVSYLTSGSLLLNYNVAVDNVITVRIPQ